ncbi:unnamed protein product [Phaedon cochleariae]|uniref:Uncharacterized protein n=1 Tax=Phaedon cochleariae TaxID=80249 RepID=A0A9N9X4S0_PHACE|nr:unnamed protein product [Phaedon cochleariae]
MTFHSAHLDTGRSKQTCRARHVRGAFRTRTATSPRHGHVMYRCVDVVEIAAVAPKAETSADRPLSRCRAAGSHTIILRRPLAKLTVRRGKMGLYTMILRRHCTVSEAARRVADRQIHLMSLCGGLRTARESGGGSFAYRRVTGRGAWPARATATNGAPCSPLDGTRAAGTARRVPTELVNSVSFLANEILKELKDVEVVTNVDDVIRSSEGTQLYLQGVSCAAMEEADGRLMLHVNDMVENGIRCIVIRSSDTDVLVLAVSHYHALHRKGLRELWLHFGAGLKRRFISVHGIAGVLGEDTSIALRGFHAFTGCDTVSFFGSRGKQSAWNAFLNCSK